jgi:hypothetical protein
MVVQMEEMQKAKLAMMLPMMHTMRHPYLLAKALTNGPAMNYVIGNSIV